MSGVREQEKELRFTRARQAVVFWVVAAMSAMAVVTVVVVSLERAENPRLPHPAWALIPLAICGLAVRLAIRLTRHAYLILTPLGVDVFPFFRPEKGMRTVFWNEIDSFEADGCRLTLHFNAERTAGLHLSLRPIPGGRRSLLVEALRGRLGENG